MSNQAVFLDELFLSIQGEANQSGRAHLFTRLSGCPLRCLYCDTARSWVRRETCEAHFPDGELRLLPNPVSLDVLRQTWADLAEAYGCTEPVMAITGGEPLEQAVFLMSALANYTGEVMLETAGLFSSRLRDLLPVLTSVSLDWKLPTTLREPSALLEPLACLQVMQASSTPFWIKMVYQHDTLASDIGSALAQIAEHSPGCQVWLQPATPARSTDAPIDGKRMLSLLNEHSHLPLDLRAQPQGHPFWGIA